MFCWRVGDGIPDVTIPATFGERLKSGPKREQTNLFVIGREYFGALYQGGYGSIQWNDTVKTSARTSCWRFLNDEPDAPLRRPVLQLLQDSFGADKSS